MSIDYQRVMKIPKKKYINNLEMCEIVRMFVPEMRNDNHITTSKIVQKNYINYLEICEIVRIFAM